MSLACSCHAVSDAEVVEAIRNGARTVEEITEACGAGADCRTCIPTLEGFLALAASDSAGNDPVSDSPVGQESKSARLGSG